MRISLHGCDYDCDPAAFQDLIDHDFVQLSLYFALSLVPKLENDQQLEIEHKFKLFEKEINKNYQSYLPSISLLANA